jgi:hypothetical protein
MKAITAAVVASCALTLGACAQWSEYGSNGTRAPAAHAFRDMYDRPPVRPRKASVKARADQPAEAPQTVGSTASEPAPGPRMYSPEWWAQERAREARENERVRRVIQICHGC